MKLEKRHGLLQFSLLLDDESLGDGDVGLRRIECCGIDLELGLGLFEFGFGLVCRLDDFRSIDLGQHLALPYAVADINRLRPKIAGDFGEQVRIVVGLDRARLRRRIHNSPNARPHDVDAEVATNRSFRPGARPAKQECWLTDSADVVRRSPRALRTSDSRVRERQQPRLRKARLCAPAPAAITAADAPLVVLGGFCTVHRPKSAAVTAKSDCRNGARHRPSREETISLRILNVPRPAQLPVSWDRGALRLAFRRWPRRAEIGPDRRRRSPAPALAARR